jgi:hypothetical protein
VLNLVKLVNVGDTDFTDRWNSQRYLIKAGSEQVVPLDAAIVWLGDPNSRDLSKSQRNRTNEFRRLRTRAGCYENGVWEDMRPQLEVYTQDGERVYMVSDDPDGLQGAAPEFNAQTTETLYANELKQLMEDSKKTQAALQQVLQILTPEQRAVLSGEGKPGTPEPTTITKPPPPVPSPKTPPQDKPSRPKVG